jgi:GTP-binding protein
MVSFKRARNMPKLGPDGGNGGIGGSVFLVGNTGLNTLSSLRYKQMFKAEHGGKGGVNNRTGFCGQDLCLPVPLGTIAFDEGTGLPIGEITASGETLLVAKGGKRGYGNLSYASSTNQAPYKNTQGQKGERRNVKLELKLMADIGLAGLPNAGKSSLLSVLSAAKPKIADYPFTTLAPELGVVEQADHDRFDSFVIADIPGLIEGASLGRGLGFQFLKHLERTKAIIFVIDGFAEAYGGEKPEEAYEQLKHEIASYHPEMVAKLSLIVINKTDLAENDENQIKEIAARFEKYDLKTCFISTASLQGIPELKRELFALLAERVLKAEEALV